MPTRPLSTLKLSLAALAACASCALVGSAQAGETVRTSKIVTGLTYPTYVTHAPGDTTRLFVLEKRGAIRIVNLATNTLLATPFLDIDPLVTGGASVNDEQGLLGLAFDPGYSTNGQFYVYYTGSGGATNVVARYTVSANPNIANGT
ncbi:MAG: PQQ-dependent sugar dehydrogenase, partial [Phycisphaerae bacterium]|nr:PQQ-dependent sugar dehydrogenase [Phycisphaerae bacterium]